MDLTNDLDQILLVVLGTLGGIITLLFLMAAIEPRTEGRHTDLPSSQDPAHAPR